MRFSKTSRRRLRLALLAGAVLGPLTGLFAAAAWLGSGRSTAALTAVGQAVAAVSAGLIVAGAAVRLIGRLAPAGRRRPVGPVLVGQVLDRADRPPAGQSTKPSRARAGAR